MDITVKVTCPCCKKEFTATGITLEEAFAEASEILQCHLDLEVC